jgi:hypothetical protein
MAHSFTDGELEDYLCEGHIYELVERHVSRMEHLERVETERLEEYG